LQKMPLTISSLTRMLLTLRPRTVDSALSFDHGIITQTDVARLTHKLGMRANH
jgi:hypothetical protein